MIDDAKRIKAEYRSSIRSKVLIKNALLSLMREKSFDKITVTDIVDRADINRFVTFVAAYRAIILLFHFQYSLKLIIFVYIQGISR